MKRKIFLSLISAAFIIAMSSFTVAYYTTKKIVDNLWQQLGISEMNGKTNIRQSFLNGALYYIGAKNIKNIALNKRAAVATDLLSYTKKFIATPEFNKEYLKFRQDMKPYAPETPKTKESIRQEYIAQAEKELQNIQKSLPSTTNETLKKYFTDRIPVLKKDIEDLKSPDCKRVAIAWQAEENQIKWRNDAYQKALQKWEADYPENYLQLVKTRLMEFLDKTNDIDYNAELTETGGKKIFVNPLYEAKNGQWKMAFRAGKEVTETARTFVQQWVKELI
jgi:hypothetical protein